MAQSNPALKKLGFSATDRVVIIHADDIGMCQATLAAYADLVEFGLLSSAAVMVPCPWFPQAAAYCRERPGVDMGVHLTLTSEWDGYRWGPMSTIDRFSGLLDREGYFHRLSEDVQAAADSDAVRGEIKAQIQRAQASGIDVTHIDTHMGSAAHRKFLLAYIQLGLQHHVPPLVLRSLEPNWMIDGMDEATKSYLMEITPELEEQGVPLIDHIGEMSLKDPTDRIEQAKHAFAALQPGITHFILHPAADTPEIRAIAPDWRCRVADQHAFMSEELRDFIRDQGIQIIGFRALRELMRS